MVSWIMVQIAAITTASFGAPDWVMKMIIITLVIGFPVAMVLAWAFEMTPEGMRPTETIPSEDSIASQTGRKLDWAILAGLLVVGGLMVFAQFFSPSKAPHFNAEDLTADRAETSSIYETGTTIPSIEAETPTTQSIAVLPFEDYSADKDQDYFAKGISEELLNVLARISGLRVASRTSAFAFAGQNKSLEEISQALNVSHVLEGSVRKAGETLRITAKLVDTQKDGQVWTATYDRPLTAKNIFDVQDEIAEAIVEELKGRLSVAPDGKVERTESLEAYQLYLRAREKANERLPGPLKEAIQGFKDVIALDPRYSHAYSGLADSYMLAAAYGALPAEAAKPEARVNIDRALVLSPNSAETLTSAAMYDHMFSENPESVAAIDYALKAVAANPNYSLAFHRLGQAYAKRGDYEKSLKAFEQARNLDPLSASILNNIARIQRLSGDWKAAKATTLDNIKWNPEQPAGHIALAVFYFDEGDFVNSFISAKNAQALNPDDPYPPIILKEVFLKAKLYDQALALDNSALMNALIAVETGDFQTAKEIFPDLKDRGDRAYLAYMMKDLERAASAYENVINNYGYKTLEADTDNLVDFANISFVFAKLGLPKGMSYRERLKDYFGDKSAAQFELQNQLWAGAVLKASGQNPKKALPWIDRMIALGQADNLLDGPAFDALRKFPEFEERQHRMAENRTNLNEAIKGQLAAPNQNWIGGN